MLTGPYEGRTRLVPGDVIIIPAGRVHACNPDQGRWRYQMIHTDQAWAVSLAPDREMNPLFDGIRVLRHPEAYARVSGMNDAIFADEAREALEARFTLMLVGLDSAPSAHLAAGDAAPDLHARLAPVIHRLRTDQSNPALTELAQSVGMTKYQLIRAMRRVTGLSPLAWRQNDRVVRARRMLRHGRPIADTAHALGFTDQSHFHRVFRAHVAASPGSYRG